MICKHTHPARECPDPVSDPASQELSDRVANRGRLRGDEVLQHLLDDLFVDGGVDPEADVRVLVEFAGELSDGGVDAVGGVERVLDDVGGVEFGDAELDKAGAGRRVLLIRDNL